ncbi:MAG TPA: LytR C-terminal domain-containing protein [Patescibacteria group bacterium]|nr:LytR C-terminal domain-containing protein [Patescibacteria group bacterium]
MSSAKVSSSQPYKSRAVLAKQYILIVSLLVIILGLGGVCIYLYTQYESSRTILQNPAQATEKKVASVIAQIGRHYLLPTNEEPTLATVSDVTKRAGEPFFAKAHNGDEVLIYPRAKLAILYRPSLDKIITIGEVNTTALTSPTSSSSSAPVRIALYNATQVNGLTKQVEQQLSSFSSVETTVVEKTNATNSYPTSLVVDLTSKDGAQAKLLSDFVKGSVGPLPTGEVKPQNADILIILGDSYAGSPTATPTVSLAP